MYKKYERVRRSFNGRIYNYYASEKNEMYYRFKNARTEKEVIALREQIELLKGGKRKKPKVKYDEDSLNFSNKVIFNHDSNIDRVVIIYKTLKDEHSLTLSPKNVTRLKEFLEKVINESTN